MPKDLGIAESELDGLTTLLVNAANLRRSHAWARYLDRETGAVVHAARWPCDDVEGVCPSCVLLDGGAHIHVRDGVVILDASVWFVRFPTGRNGMIADSEFHERFSPFVEVAPS